MLVSEALEMLTRAPQGEKPARINPVMSQAQAVDIVRKGLLSHPLDSKVSALYEKRVWQVFKNQRRPKY
jgi:hypothetical protein